MKFIEVEIIEWYDDIIRSFCKTENNNIYYCSILARNTDTDEKVYLCVDIKYLSGYSKLKEILKYKSVAKHWNELFDLIHLKVHNETYIIKTKNIKDDIHLMKYKQNFQWPNDIISGEYPLILEKAKHIEDWMAYKDIIK